MKRTIILGSLCAAALLASALLYLNWRADTPAGARLRAVIRPAAKTHPGWTAYVSTLAAAPLSDPFGVAIADDGTVYVADGGDGNRILRIGTDGAVSVFAGGREGFADGVGAAAAFNTPSAIALDRKGNLYVADTGNHAIRRVAPDGTVTTLAGDGTPGYADGQGAQARFNGPVGIAVDRAGVVYVADTYNDDIRRIAPNGAVTTIAGIGRPSWECIGNVCGFDTPTALAVAADGTLYVADTGNNTIRKIAKDGAISTFVEAPSDERRPDLREPMGLALARDGYLYVACGSGGRILEVAPDGSYHAIQHAEPARRAEFGSDGSVRLYGPRGLALARDGSLIAADALTRHVERLSSSRPAPSPEPTAQVALSKKPMPWPVSPQFEKHEVVGLMGEVRGSYDGESRDHFHAGLDIRADVGQPVLAVQASKVTDPLANWGFGKLGEGMSLGDMSYIHMRVGRDAKGRAVDPRFEVRSERMKAQYVRVRRGTRFAVGDTLGTVNAMAHVHLEYYPGGPLVNPLALPFTGISDGIAPHIEAIGLYDSDGKALRAKRGKQLHLARSLGSVGIVVEAYDQMDDNLARRRLGLYKLGYQLLHADGTPLPGFEQPLITQVYDRLPREREAVKLVYAAQSGITVYGSKRTRFAYAITNTLHDGLAAPGAWKIDALAPGDYLLRVYAADFAGHAATDHRDLALTIE